MIKVAVIQLVEDEFWIVKVVTIGAKSIAVDESGKKHTDRFEARKELHDTGDWWLQREGTDYEVWL